VSRPDREECCDALITTVGLRLDRAVFLCDRRYPERSAGPAAGLFRFRAGNGTGTTVSCVAGPVDVVTIAADEGGFAIALPVSEP
jgi:hypothetical protein